MRSLIEVLADRTIGIVERVNANVIHIRINLSAPHAMALNTGIPLGFPKINGYLLIPNESGATVCVVKSVQIDRQPYLKHRGMQSADLVDLPVPMRSAELTPLGTLISNGRSESGAPNLELQRGVDVFPSVGDSVLLPTNMQMHTIVEGESTNRDKRIHIGKCPTANNAPVYINPNNLFGRHLAVLGNTGAGKSCTVAGLIRWSLEAAQEARGDKKINARFIILDPNGEYARALDDLNPQVFDVEGKHPTKPLKVPAWMWNGEEWAAFTDAASGVQRPILFDAIRRLRVDFNSPNSSDILGKKLRMRAEGYHKELLNKIKTEQHLKFHEGESVAELLGNLSLDLETISENAKEPLSSALQTIVQKSREVEQAARKKPIPGATDQNSATNWYHNQFNYGDLEEICNEFEEIYRHLRTVAQNQESTNENLSIDENTPAFFPVNELVDHVMMLAANSQGRDATQFVDSLKLRIKDLFATGPLASIADSNSDYESSPTLEDWLETYLGANQNLAKPISVLDLSFVPSEVVHIVVSVLARMLFEAVQRHKSIFDSELPTVLIIDEAHKFVRQERKFESITNAEKACCRTFERIAREGRKYGLGLVLASQRPSDISTTVLSQCNTFLLHRIVNDHDQDLVRRLVPDGLGDLLRELPSLPSRRAILLGWGSPTPLLTEIRELKENERPHSFDPEFWNAWIGKPVCTANWLEVRQKWIPPNKSTAAMSESEISVEAEFDESLDPPF